MKIVFVTTLSSVSSTMIGRVIPLATELSNSHDVHIFLLGSVPAKKHGSVQFHSVGEEPFTRTSSGKERLRGTQLVSRMVVNAYKAADLLRSQKPDVVVYVKSLPQNALTSLLVSPFHRFSKTILDMDDFELTANVLTSLAQRAAVHWGERVLVKRADVVTVATPFLADHVEQLTGLKKKGVLVPTGLSFSYMRSQNPARPTLTYIGSVSRSSGHGVDMLPAILEEVKKSVPEVKLNIVGGGDDVESLTADFAGRNLTQAVEFHGRFMMDDIDEILHDTSVLLDPVNASVAARAKSSFRVALSLCAGIPIVTSNVGIRSSLIPKELHKLFFADPGNTNTYADRCIALLQSPLGEKESALLVNAAQQYTWDVLAKKFEHYL